MRSIRVVDSHTGGEPTRLVIENGPALGAGPLAERLQLFKDQHDDLRKLVVNEPRGFDAMVGGLLCEPDDRSCSTAVIFFNNTGYLGMCGHGAIGVIATLAHLGKVSAGSHRIETPAGIITAHYLADGIVEIENVASFRHAEDVSVETPTLGRIEGDIAYGGNWFFLVKQTMGELELDRVLQLSQNATEIRHALQRAGITGAHGARIDHIEFFSAPRDEKNDSRNFVLCPGGAYDRSPCGTGTSAKLACLAADGKLAPNETWRQESITGSVFTGRYRPDVQSERIVPTIGGRAYVTSEATLLIDPNDPLNPGVRC